MHPIKITRVDSKRAAGNLEQLRKKPNHHAIILYYRDGCPPCDKMKPAWDAACDKFGKRYKCKTSEIMIANVDPTGLKFLEKMDYKFHTINGTPSLKHSSSAGVSEFNENRDEETFIKWLQKSLHDVIVDAHETDADNNNQHERDKPQIKMGGGGDGCWLKDMFKTRKYRRGRSNSSRGRSSRSSRSNNRRSNSRRNRFKLYKNKK